MLSISRPAANTMGEVLKLALQHSDHHDIAAADADTIFIAFLLTRLDTLGVPGAIQVRERLQGLRIKGINARNGS